MFVSAEGEPYILRIENTRTHELIEFDGYGVKVRAKAPPPDQVLDYDELFRK